MGPGDLSDLVAPLSGILGFNEHVLVGPETSDDAGVFELDGTALVATADFITPVCDDPRRFGRVAAANSISDVYAMGGRVLFALNLCCFPEPEEHKAMLAEVLAGAAEKIKEAGGALLGGHSVRDVELKFGLVVIGQADRDRLLTNAGALVGQHLLLTKPLGTGVLLNAFKFSKLDEAGLEPALVEMERLNAKASALALEYGATGCTDITGFGLAGHALEMARASKVGLRIEFDRLPVYERFYDLAKKGISTGCTDHNKAAAAAELDDRRGLDKLQTEVLFDPQTSGGLLIALAAARADDLLQALRDAGHLAADIGEVTAGPPRFEVV